MSQENAPSYLNPNSKKDFLKKRNQLFSSEELREKILAGNKVALSRAITLIESKNPNHHVKGLELVNSLTPQAGKSIRVGITGVPGVGKSTFIESLGKHLLEKGLKLGVLAIDPSSSRSKGSILGDKTRMESLSQEESVFIRPSPSSGSLGGVAKTTRESITLLEAAGYDVVLIETVGVGQSEIVVSHMVDFFLLLMITGAGDELQGIKRGIMEMADGIVINKVEAHNEKDAKLAKRQLLNALHLFPLAEHGQPIEVLLASALKQKGIDGVWNSIKTHIDHNRKSGFFETRRKKQAKYWLVEAIRNEFEQSFFDQPEIMEELEKSEKALAEQTISPFLLAQQLLAKFYRSRAQE